MRLPVVGPLDCQPLVTRLQVGFSIYPSILSNLSLLSLESIYFDVHICQQEQLQLVPIWIQSWNFGTLGTTNRIG